MYDNGFPIPPDAKNYCGEHKSQMADKRADPIFALGDAVTIGGRWKVEAISIGDLIADKYNGYIIYRLSCATVPHETIVIVEDLLSRPK